MKIEIESMWSPDLSPPSEGVPSDIKDFNVFIQISLRESGKPGSEVFNCRVCSPMALARMQTGMFISHTLVLKRFEWGEIKKRIDKLLMHVSSCSDWDCVLKKLSCCLEYSDIW